MFQHFECLTYILLSLVLLALSSVYCSGQNPLPTPLPTGSNYPQANDILCNTTSVGDPTIEIGPQIQTLSEFIRKINAEKQTKLVLDSSVPALGIQISMTAPWTSILRMLMDQQNLGSICYDDDIVLIKPLSDIANNAEQKRRSAPIVHEVFKLRYLQVRPFSPVDPAGQIQETSNDAIQSLEDSLKSIIRTDGDPRSEIKRIAGTNEFLVAARQDQMEEIRRLIEQVDHPRYQIHLKAVLYSVDEKRLRESGSRFSAIMGNANQTNFLQAVGTSSANDSDAILGILNFKDTATFLEQLARAQQHDVVRVLARPFGVVFDGDTLSFDAGTQVPIALRSENDQLRFVMASRIVRINPQVSASSDGYINFVSLNIQVENNVVDKSSGKYKGLPAIDRQSVQTILRLRDGQTAVFGGLTDPTDKVLSRTPILSGIPGLGDLFKHRKKETLYCALTIQVLPQ